MTRRVFTTKSKKEQLEQQVLMLIRVIRRNIDKDVMDKAQEIAVAAQNAKGDKKNVSDEVPYDKENANSAIAKYLALNKNNPELCQKILKQMREHN